MTVGNDLNDIDHDLRLHRGGASLIVSQSYTGFDFTAPTEASYLVTVLPRRGIKSVKSLSDSMTLGGFDDRCYSDTVKFGSKPFRRFTVCIGGVLRCQEAVVRIDLGPLMIR